MNVTYLPVLFAHSWLRWVVLLLLAAVVVRSLAGRAKGPWTAAEDRLHAAAVGSLDLEFLLGLWLYAVASPSTRAFFAAPGASMSDPVLRFYGLEHIAMMLLGVAVVHIGRARSKRRTDGAKRRSTVVWWTVAGLALILAAVPWPPTKAGRPLLRTSDARVEQQAPVAATSLPTSPLR